MKLHELLTYSAIAFAGFIIVESAVAQKKTATKATTAFVKKASVAVEPAYVQAYRTAAMQLVEDVTSATDILKNFRASDSMKDLNTSAAVRDELTTHINNLDRQMQRVDSMLLTTATQVLHSSRLALEAANQISTHLKGSP